MTTRTAPRAPDAALVERLRVRDRSAWDELYRLYEGRLYGFAYRLTGSSHDAADLVQETFVRALPRLDRLPAERADVGAYLYATARNLFLKDVERGRRQRPVEEVPEPDEPGPVEDDPQRAALLRGQQREVRLANARLAPRQRLVLALRELEERSYAEIGELVGLNENAVAQLISRARQSLREELRLVQVDRSRLPADCQALLPHLSAYLDGQLREPKRSETLGHLEGCERCQAALADMREASRRYRALVPPAVGIAALRGRVEDALASSGYWRPRPRFATAFGSRATLIAVSAGVLVAGGAVGGGAALVSARDTGAPPAASDSAAGAVSTAEPAESEQAPALAEPLPVPAEPSPVDVVESEPAPGEPAEPAAPGDAPSPVEAPAEDDLPGEQKPEAPPEEPQPESEPQAPPADTTAPAVVITGAPPGSTQATAATFEFTADEAASFRCRLDGGSAQPCASPAGYGGLGVGTHVFEVEATDGAGNAATVSYTWAVEAPALPDLVIASLGPGGVTVANIGSAPAGPFAIGIDGFDPIWITTGLAAGASETRGWPACITDSVTVIADTFGEVEESSEGNNAVVAAGGLC